jgi:predicted Zn-dependent protease
MIETVEKHFRDLSPAVDFCSLRLVSGQDEVIEVRQDILQPVTFDDDVGAMITVVDAGGLGYAATSNLTASGLRHALERATRWAWQTATTAVVDRIPLGDS